MKLITQTVHSTGRMLRRRSTSRSPLSLLFIRYRFMAFTFDIQYSLAEIQLIMITRALISRIRRSRGTPSMLIKNI